MSDDYYHQIYAFDDLNKLNTLREQLGNSTWKAFMAFNTEAMESGALSQKEKQLVSLAASLVAKCPYSIKVHAENARKFGASDKEVAEVVFVTATTLAAGIVGHGTMTVRPAADEES